MAIKKKRSIIMCLSYSMIRRQTQTTPESFFFFFMHTLCVCSHPTPPPHHHTLIRTPCECAAKEFEVTEKFICSVFSFHVRNIYGTWYPMIHLLSVESYIYEMQNFAPPLHARFSLRCRILVGPPLNLSAAAASFAQQLHRSQKKK